MDFNTRLKNIRKRNKTTQKTLSEYLGINLRTYQRYEEGTVEPPLSNVMSIAKYFNLPVDCLLGNGLFADWENILLHKHEILYILKNSSNLFPDNFDLSALTESQLANILPAIFAKITFDGSNMNLYPLIPVDYLLPQTSVRVDEP